MQDISGDIPCVYFSSTADGIITEANAPLCQLLGYNRDELVGGKLESILSLATRIFQQTHLYPLLQLKGHAEEIYITLRSKPGDDVPVLINATRLEKNGQNNLLFAGIAIVTRKKFEEEIIAAKKAAEKALKENTALKAAREELEQRAEELDTQLVLANLHNEELKQFTHLVTHTLQEPLRKLLFFSSRVLETGVADNTNTATMKIRTAAEDMYSKLKGLQQYAWLTNEELNWEEVNLLRLMETAKEQLEIENPGISIVLESEAIPLIQADRGQMMFLLKELMSNAVRFRKPGNLVHIKIYASTLLLNKFRHLAEKYKYAEFVKLQIRDSGIGFDGKFQEQAFQLFRKLHPTGGQGIGLSLCKKLLENHHGSISLESQKDIGTNAIIFLPLEQKKTVL